MKYYGKQHVSCTQTEKQGEKEEHIDLLVLDLDGVGKQHGSQVMELGRETATILVCRVR
jgi:hypothetical protein